jgi:hypothetical protein
MWIFPALSILAWAASSTAANGAQFPRHAIVALGIPAIFVAGINLLTFRESQFLAMDIGSLTFIDAFAALLSGVGGGLLRVLLPFQPGSIQAAGFVRFIEIAALGGVGWLVWLCLRRCRPIDQRLSIALVSAFVTSVAMTVLARPSIEPGFFWPPKWVGISHVLLVLYLAFCFDRFTPRIRIEVTALALGMIVWLSFTASHCAVAIHAPQGRLHAVARATARRAEFQRLLGALGELAARLKRSTINLPPAPREQLFAEFPGLEDYPLDELLAAAPRHTPAVLIRPGPLEPDVARALAAVPPFAHIYNALLEAPGIVGRTIPTGSRLSVSGAAP